YGTGSSRDWAAKGPRLLGVRAVIAESFERIHRSNLVGMGVVPLEFTGADTVERLGLTGREVVEVTGLAAAIAGGLAAGNEVTVRAVPDAAKATGSGSGSGGGGGGEPRAAIEFKVRVRLDTPQEVQY